MSSSIKNYNWKSFRTLINKDGYYDFKLNNTASYLTLSDFNNIPILDLSEINYDGFIKTIPVESTWAGRKNEGVNSTAFGLTALDNGTIEYDFNSEQKQEDHVILEDLLTNSVLDIQKDDFNVYFNSISGVTQEHFYDTFVSGKRILFNGGYYQAFFKLDGYDYQLLPTKPLNGWSISLILNRRTKPETQPKTLLNDLYPENDGIFFYMGVRGENKFWNKFDGNNEDN